MLKLNRVNSTGRQYYLSEMYGSANFTEIRTGDKAIIVEAHIQTLSQAWYNWQMEGQFIQKAFAFLSADEREFILTGTTAEEWNELFDDEGYND